MMTGEKVRCRFCGAILLGWLLVQDRPDGAMLLHHLGRMHPTEVRRFLDQMRTSHDIARVAMQGFEVVEEVGEGPMRLHS